MGKVVRTLTVAFVFFLACLLLVAFAISANWIFFFGSIGLLILSLLIARSPNPQNGQWRVFASTDPSVEGKTMEDMMGKEAAELMMQHFSQPNPGSILLVRDPSGKWREHVSESDDQ